ncbi:MAG: helix-turn-helix transcriptional regulator [Pseudomonadota bacterium]
MNSASDLIMNWRSAMMAMVVIPLILCGLLLLFRQVEQRAARPLGLFLIFGGLSMMPQIIGFAGAYQIWPWLTFCPLFFVDLWLGPLLIIHAHALMRDSPLHWRRWLLLPGLLQTTYYTGAFLLPGDGLLDTPAKWAFNNAVHEPIIVPIESVTGILLFGLAIILIWRNRAQYLNFLEQTQSAARDYDPVWLRNLILALCVGAGIYAVIEILSITIGLSYPAAFPALVALTTVLTWIGLDAAWRLTSPFPKMPNAADTSMPTHETVADGQRAADDLGPRILHALIQEQWYLEPRLSVRDVAKRLGSNETYVSRAVNRSLGGSFNSVVNTARIDHAKTLLADPHRSILTIAMESGFNSKATFNRVFRDLVGLSPTQFRQGTLNDKADIKSQIP